MKADIAPLIVGFLIFIASLASLKLGISVVIMEIILGVTAGNMGLQPEEWMLYLAGLGGIVLTFLAGAEVDMKLMKKDFHKSFLIGFFSFLAPFIAAFAYTYLVADWEIRAALIAGTALSETSIAVVYSVLVETGLIRTDTGKLLLSATFITNTFTALALSVLFAEPSVYTLGFIVVSALIIVLAVKFSHHVFENPSFKNKIIEPEIKYIFFLLLAFIYLAKLGNGHALLPAFFLGLFMSGHFNETSGTHVVKNRLRTVAFALIMPIFFIVVGMKVSIPLVASAFGLFIVLFVIKQAAKFLGVYFLAKRFIPDGSMYVTLLKSTGLTFGLIATLFGLQAGYIDNVQYSVLTAVLILSAILPTFVAQKWFMPRHSEDMLK